MDDELGELDYLRQIELLALDVVAAREPQARHRAVEELGRQLQHMHYPGDGCVDRERGMLHLGGAAIVTPEVFGEYGRLCALLGVPERAQGWALWFTWDEQGAAHTMVTTVLDTTQALLAEWARGRAADPVRPVRAQVAAVVRGWLGPMTRSPGNAARHGLGGR
ncbi:hypothetical protein [Actinoplanes sp. N902-109]|uniref:hypothetical protein n=1 Tax=Actinoplanes sp. (strain N902-109) TaxID=649831 RepID=UPI001E54A1E5|nr:hypothetical protein [Actinoplanes sp. N902-109]